LFVSFHSSLFSLGFPSSVRPTLSILVSSHSLQFPIVLVFLLLHSHHFFPCTSLQYQWSIELGRKEERPQSWFQRPSTISKNMPGVEWWPKWSPRYSLVIIKIPPPSLRVQERVKQLQKLLLVPLLLFLPPEFHSKPSQHH
jgi:hypothetical protein